MAHTAEKTVRKTAAVRTRKKRATGALLVSLADFMKDSKYYVSIGLRQRQVLIMDDGKHIATIGHKGGPKIQKRKVPPSDVLKARNN